MRFFCSRVILLCAVLVLGLVIFSSCATSTAADQPDSRERETATLTDSETGKGDEEDGAVEGSEGDSASKAAADGQETGESANGGVSESAEKQRITLPPSREIPVDQLMEMVGRSIPQRFIFLSDNEGEPLRIYHDLDRNGYEDIFLLLVEFPEDIRSGSRSGNGSETGGETSTEGDADTGDSSRAGESANLVQPSGDRTAQSEPQQPQSQEAQSDEQVQPLVSPQIELEPDEPQAEAIINNRKVAASDLADMSRLFSEEIRPHKFYLALLLRTPSGLVSMYRIPLGSWFVFEDFRGFRLNERRAMPYVVSIAFQTHEGKKSQWVCFSDFNEFSFFTLNNSLSVSTEIRDINDNGFLDILEWRRVFEEGTGYETFLTWYKWDSKKYAQHDTTNVVRNLNQFLHTMSSLLSMGKWSQVFSMLLPAEQYQELRDENDSMGALFLKLFPAQPGRDDSEPIDDAEIKALIDKGDRVFNTVIVPRVLENPFAGEKQGMKPDYRTRFSIRFILRDGRSSVRECRVRMNENPFAGTQYFIEPQEATQ